MSNDVTRMTSIELLSYFLETNRSEGPTFYPEFGKAEAELLRRLDGPPSAELEIDRLRNSLNRAAELEVALRELLAEAKDLEQEIEEYTNAS